MRTSQIFLLSSIILSLATFGCSPRSMPPQTATTSPSMTLTPKQVVLDTIEGSFRNQIDILEKNMPRAQSEAYVIPSKREQADFSKLVSLIYGEKLTSAVELANENYYTLNYYADRGNESAFSYLLREQRPIQKGWGLYAFRVDSTSNIIVEAPHPLYDKRTASIALDIYRALNARALLIAGAHRNANEDGSADVAHAPESIFQSIHESLSREIQADSETPIIIQIHGFHSSKHNGYPQTVIGLGNSIQPMESDLATKLEKALSVQGVQAGVCIGDTWTDLCGKTNVQGASPDGIIFFHIELQETMRKNSDALIAALLQVFGK